MACAANWTAVRSGPHRPRASTTEALEDSTVHVLTKIFIVLVSLLAVLIVPLVVVYAHNEDSYKRRYDAAEARAASLNSALSAAQAAAGASQVALETKTHE